MQFLFDLLIFLYLHPSKSIYYVDLAKSHYLAIWDIRYMCFSKKGNMVLAHRVYLDIFYHYLFMISVKVLILVMWSNPYPW
jgi:hypothetical protein